ncbi:MULTISPECIES: TetR/AcrR family transcriptional regulator [unclassified Acidiphilium]|uniref:TetR/AcrR family transcriptional regulator n=1 Tax=unclassified Acidiphilium TaxID=2617493 RepID=UPI000BC62EFE|nr:MULTISPECIES: TetR/AcrR family transcriptional regulator [unclassified Acidiphilium]OYV55733.1 MAG: TetR family transcriptional regulator [Acidiphilium sp. 20-67-58]HQT60760.1 TetR/AcrR family transcriptional regulator [Acidiphilium sp.]
MNIVTRVCRRRDTADAARQRRDALIETAERIFLRKGYHATTMDDIAAEAGMSKRTLYQLVESKEDLFTALLERRRRPLDVSGIETAGRPVADVLNDMIRLWAHHVMSPSIIALARLIMAEYMHGRTLSRLLDREGAKPCRDALRDYFAACNARGDLAIDDPEETAHMLYGMAIGNIHIEMLLGIGKTRTRAEIDARIARAVTLFLNGARAVGQGAVPVRETLAQG